MEALLLAIVIGFAMLFSGFRLKGMFRWSLITGSLIILLTTMSRTCEANPGFCSFDWVFDTLQNPLPLPDVRSPSPDFPAPSAPYPDSPTPAPDTPYPDPETPTTPYPETPEPNTPYPDDLPPADTQSPSPAYPPFRTPTPVPSPQPTTRPTRPDLDPCRDGNCTCVDYKCLW